MANDITLGTTLDTDTGSTLETNTGTTLDKDAASPALIDAETTEQTRRKREVVKQEAEKLTGQAGDRIRAFAEDGKARASGVLDELAQTIEDAATTIDEKVGAQFGGYARNASTAVSDFSRTLADKDVDDLVEDAREFVKKSPGIAIGAAAAIGFVLARVIQSGVDANRRA